MQPTLAARSAVVNRVPRSLALPCAGWPSRTGQDRLGSRPTVAAAQYVLAQLSDSHLRAGAEGDASAAALAAAVERVLALDRQPDAVLVSGDLVDSGEPDQYARVRELLAPLPMPVHVLVGNHDDRALLRATFDVPGDGELVQYALRLGPLRLVCGDTIQPGTDAGFYGPERLRWLAAALAEDRETPTIVALHHPAAADRHRRARRAWPARG